MDFVNSRPELWCRSGKSRLALACLDISMMHFLVVGGGKAHVCCEKNTLSLEKYLLR